jgi:putative ABC transport system permease protein
MLIHYFKTAWRNIWKNKSISALNILGLSIGIGSSIVLLSYVSYQHGYDRFHANQENIYRLNLGFYQDNKLVFQSSENYSAVGPALKKEFPEVLEVARLYNMGYKNNCVFTANDVFYKETKFLYADASFFKIFSYPFLEGDPMKALIRPYTAVISATTAAKFFGKQDAMGKFIQMDDDDRNSELCQITGIFKDLPENSHLQFNILISYPTLYHRNGGIKRFENNWTNKDFYTYLLLRPHTNSFTLQERFPKFVSDHIPGEKSNQEQSRLALQPLWKNHFSSNLADEPGVTVNEKTIGFLIIIGLFIITIAWVNYINLATAGSFSRGKEIGVRKVLGSKKRDLISQFLIESLWINSLSFIIAIVLVYSFQPMLNSLLNVTFSLSDLFDHAYGLLFMGFLLLGTLGSGFYPAFVLSSFRPALALKGRIRASLAGLRLRKSLVIFQFALSIFLMTGTVIVYQQVHYMLTQDLGMDTNQVLLIDRPGRWDRSDSVNSERLLRFKESLEKIPGVSGFGMADAIPGKEIRSHLNYYVKNSTTEKPMDFNTIGVDEGYLPVLGMKILEGRNFSLKFKTDEDAVIITRSAARLLGFHRDQDAIGKQLMQNHIPFTIIGLIDEVHHQSLEKRVEPLILQFNANDYEADEYYLVKFKTAEVHQVTQRIESSWNDIFRGSPFSFSFLDEYFNRQYQNEFQFGILFGVFALIAIGIACMGLFTLVAFMVKQRVKEIGVRKVLGASLPDIIILLTRDFIQLVILANLIAWPLGWLLMNNWLKDFAYRISASWVVFLLAGLAAILIALLTISYQSIKAAIANPIQSLRSE